MKSTIGAVLMVAAWLPAATGQEVRADRTNLLASEVRDAAGLFSVSEVDTARASLREIESKVKISTIIETVESLKGKSVDDVAIASARRSGTSGIFVLIAKRETKIEVLPSHRVESALPRGKRNAIRAAFIEKFRKKDFDAGLKQGVEAIASALSGDSRDGNLPRVAEPASEKPDGETRRGAVPSLVSRKPEATAEAAKEFGVPRDVAVVQELIIREQVRLALLGAQAILEAAQKQAESMKVKANIWVVDDGGHPLAFARMDGARPASAYTAQTKAITAATFRQPTGPILAGTTPPDVLLNISIQNAAAAGGGKITTLLGGVPIVVDGQVIGGVGVGGGSGDQDAVIARAGIDHFLSAIKAAEPSKATPTPSSSTKPTTPEIKPGDDRDF